MQINFVDAGDGAYRVVTLTGQRGIATIVEAADGTATVEIDSVEAAGRSLSPRSEHADLIAAQSFLMQAFDPDTDYERASETPAPPAAVPIAPPKPAAARHGGAGRTGWSGGPKRGTHYAAAVQIAEYFHKPSYSSLRPDRDIRDLSPEHRACHDHAEEAAQWLREAQGLSRNGFPGSAQLEMSYRGKGKRALDKAKRLFDPIVKADRARFRAEVPLAVADVVGDTKDLEVALARIAEAGFVEIGAGHHAAVYGRGRFDTIRAGNGVDGYYRQIVACDGPLAPFVGVHAPCVKDVLLTEDGGAVALVERLEPLPDEGDVPDLDEVVDQAIAVLRGTDDDTPELDLRYSRFREYAGLLREILPTVDTRRENLMLRGGELIVNDPFGRGFLESEMGPLRDVVARLPFRWGPPAGPWWDASREDRMGMGR